MRRRPFAIATICLFILACSPPPPPPPPPPATPTLPAPTMPPQATPTTVPSPTPSPTPAPAATPVPEVALDIRLWNGSGEVQLDGRTVEPGRVSVPRGEHHVALLVDGQVVTELTPPPDGGQVDLVVPPPLSPLAIVVENSDDARPQSGLPSADVVYEALAEGGISRFLAVYMSQDASVVGPVRSLRHYFAFLAGDFNADLVHIGASPEGFAWRDAMNLGKLDESAGDPGVYRVRSRFAPHNAYTNTAFDRQALAERGRQQGGSWGPLRFSPQNGTTQNNNQSAESVLVTFPPWPYRVRYSWEADAGVYRRFIGIAPHVDAVTGEQLSATSVLVQFTTVERIPNDPKLREDIDLVGASGPLLIFSGGRQREGTWSKGTPRESTRWLDGEGQPLVLPPGPVWVEIVPQASVVTAS